MKHQLLLLSLGFIATLTSVSARPAATVPTDDTEVSDLACHSACEKRRNIELTESDIQLSREGNQCVYDHWRRILEIPEEQRPVACQGFQTQRSLDDCLHRECVNSTTAGCIIWRYSKDEGNECISNAVDRRFKRDAEIEERFNICAASCVQPDSIPQIFED